MTAVEFLLLLLHMDATNDNNQVVGQRIKLLSSLQLISPL